MSPAIARFLLILFAIALMPACALDAQTPSPSLSADKLTSLWADLLEGEPTSTRAILQLAKHPAEVTEFFSTTLKPLTISREKMLELIARLDSGDEQDWRDTCQQLSYYDPRLVLGLEEILSLESVQNYPARHRLVDILSGRSIDDPYSATSRKYKFVKLNKYKGDDGDYYNFCGSEMEKTCGASWWAEPSVGELNRGNFEFQKKEWTRAVRALAILESFASPEADAIIDTLASGHADAQPTKVAAAIVSLRRKR